MRLSKDPTLAEGRRRGKGLLPRRGVAAIFEEIAAADRASTHWKPDLQTRPRIDFTASSRPSPGYTKGPAGPTAATDTGLGRYSARKPARRPMFLSLTSPPHLARSAPRSALARNLTTPRQDILAERQI